MITQQPKHIRIDLIIENGTKYTLRGWMEHNKPYLNPLFGVDQWADMIGMSNSWLNCKCHEVYKKPAKAVITDYRIETALRLLKDGYIGLISDLAKTCGMNPGVFVYWFKQRTKMTPSQYRDEIKRFSPYRYRVN